MGKSGVDGGSGEERPGYATRSSCVLTELPDGTGVVLDLETKTYVSLNATAVCAWKALAAGEARTAGDVGRALADRFEVDVETARADAARLLEHLLAERLLVADGGPPSP